jgi:hypothetical protein
MRGMQIVVSLPHRIRKYLYLDECHKKLTLYRVSFFSFLRMGGSVQIRTSDLHNVNVAL